MKAVIQLQGRTIPYELTRKPVKNINIRVRADGTVGVSAGPQVPQEELEAILRQKETFLLGALDRFASRPRRPDPGDYESGSVVYLLGQPHKVVVAKGEKNLAFREGETIRLVVADPNNASVRVKTMASFLKGYCLEVTEALCRQVQPAMAPLGVPQPQIRVRSMTSRWGSCKPAAGEITFARQLIQAPMDCVEYVVCHELVHFVHPNHSKAFYDCLATFLPDWKQRRARLNFPGDW